MIINKLDNVTFTAAQLSKRAQDEIARLWPQATEANLQRKLQGAALGLYTLSVEEQSEVTQYKTDLEVIQTEAAQAVIDNQLLIAAITHEQAVNRLARYRLAEGGPAAPIFSTQYSPETGLYEQVQIGLTSAIDPLNAQVEVAQYDEEGAVTGMALVDNPAIVADDAERAVAQAVVDGASADVIALIELRGAA